MKEGNLLDIWEQKCADEGHEDCDWIYTCECGHSYCNYCAKGGHINSYMQQDPLRCPKCLAKCLAL